MILDGESGGPYHDWQHTTPVLKKELEDAGLFKVDVVTAPQSGGDFSTFHPDFSRYQAVVLNYDGQDWPAECKASFENYIKDGGGLVIVHAADNAFPNWTGFNKMIGVGGWRRRNEKSGPLWYMKDAKLVSDNSPGSAGSHGARLPFQVTAQQPEHPIMKGLPKIWTHVADELYATLRGPGEKMTVLATARSDPGIGAQAVTNPSSRLCNTGRAAFSIPRWAMMFRPLAVSGSSRHFGGERSGRQPEP